MQLPATLCILAMCSGVLSSEFCVCRIIQCGSASVATAFSRSAGEVIEIRCKYMCNSVFLVSGLISRIKSVL